jgi:5-methylcytosine-specific restriction endonuclease McrA
MKSKHYKIHAPACAMPECSNLVGYHKKYIKEDGTPGFKWKSACEQHRTDEKMKFDEWKTEVGCENHDGHYGFDCPTVGSILTATMIDINHKDGNRKNNNPSNLERLCRCCHGQVTIQEGHHKNRYTTVPKTFDDFFNIENALDIGINKFFTVS